ncbi:MAG: C39 family peptidase [Gammaproteobacteria bacterium]|nr:C39 family peptidase [Gammaproteobacteria bacterium]
MTFAFRFADPHTAERYPLNVTGELGWQHDNDCYSAEIPLPEISSGTIVVPSLSICRDASYSFRFSLNFSDQIFALNEVPSSSNGPSSHHVPSSEKAPAGRPAEAENKHPISTHIDCFHTHQHIPTSTLRVEVKGFSNAEQYLLCVTARSITCEEVAIPQRAVHCPSPPSLSQMQANDKIKHSICSPTCLAMLLQHFDRPIDWLDFVASCRDETTGLYGVWPLGIYAASRQGCIGAVEVFDDWENAALLLESELPFVASIRYPEGSLPGAPNAASGGHLVVVHRLDEDNIHVLDPAAPTVDEVARTYPQVAFSSAWLSHRGAVYVLLP